MSRPILADTTLVVTPREYEIVRAILARHVPEREVWAFGSRTKGSTKRFSDLDLAICGDLPLPLATLAALRDDFTESELPYKVDLVDWATTSESFRERIKSHHTVVQPHGASRS